MAAFTKSSSWPQVLVVLAIAIAALITVSYIYEFLRPPFFSTTSPDATYIVNLYGQKERPALLTVEVGAVVLKDGQVFWRYQALHAGDAMDISFELGWPDHQWIGENALQFYRKENYTDSKYELALILVNTSDKVVRHLKLNCEDKFLVFDMEPKSEIRLKIPPSKGDSQSVSVTGKFDDGVTFTKYAGFDVTGVEKPFSYHVFVKADGVTIDRVF
ncbi:MAG: hypothetical protein ABL959_06885 [Pyrinomonadaceae bacterium]